jgi:hypothetical protein
MRWIYRLLIVALLPTTALAKDLGTFGETFEIIEQDMLQRMAYEASGSEFKAKLKERQEAAKAWFEGAPRYVQLGSVTKSSAFLIRHELLVTSDLEVPVLVDKITGEMVQTPTKNISNYRVERRLIARKGERRLVTENPTFRLPERFLVFDPDNRAQWEFAKRAAKMAEPPTLVATHGNILQMSKEAGKPVYMLFPSLTDIFRFETAPAFLGSTEVEGEKLLYSIQIGKDDLIPEDAETFLLANWEGPSDSFGEPAIRRVVKEIDPQAVMRQLGAKQ